MSVEFSRENIKDFNKLKESCANIFIDEYIHLPDVYSGIKEIVFVDAFPSVESTDIENSKLKVSGVLKYSIVYIPEEYFGQVKVIKGEIAYSNIIESDIQTKEELFHQTKLNVDRLEHAVINSRKISLNVTINVKSTFYSEDEKSYICDVRENYDSQILKKQSDVYIFKCFKNEQFNMSGKIEIPFERPEIEEIVAVNIVNFDNQIQNTEKGLMIEGRGRAKVIYISTNGSLSIQDMEFNSEMCQNQIFEEDYDEVHIVHRNMLKDIICEVKEDNDGEKRILNLELKYQISMEIYEKSKINYMKDFFLINNQTKIINQKHDVIKNIQTIQKSVKIRSYVDDVGEFDDFYLHVKNNITDFNFDDINNTNVKGVLKVSGMIITADNNFDGGLKHFELPYSENINIGDVNDTVGSEIKSEVTIMDVSYFPSKDNKIEIEVTLQVNIDLIKKDNIALISDIEIGTEIEYNNSERTLIKLYYTAYDDTLWEICKKFKVEQDELITVNGEIDFEKKEQGRMIIIP